MGCFISGIFIWILKKEWAKFALRKKIKDYQYPRPSYLHVVICENLRGAVVLCEEYRIAVMHYIYDIILNK